MKRFIVGIGGVIFLIAAYLLISSFTHFSFATYYGKLRNTYRLSRAIPNLVRPVQYPGYFTSAVREELNKRIANSVIALQKNWKDVDAWIDLGLSRKFINDFEGARDAWEFAAALQPDKAIPFHNLANLYGYELHDTVKAQDNFFKAMRNGSHDIYIYRSAYDFYRDVLHDARGARAVLEVGIAHNPVGSDELRNLLTHSS